jgi:hypothetical protein
MVRRGRGRRSGVCRAKFMIPSLDGVQLMFPFHVSGPDEKVFGIRTLQDAIRGVRQDRISEAAVKGPRRGRTAAGAH